MKNDTKPVNPAKKTIVTAGSLYLDIDAYACCAAMKELLTLRGERAEAYSNAACNYSVCRSLIADGPRVMTFPPDFDGKDTKYIIVDVSDPDYIRDAVPLEKVSEVYDHHTGFESYWDERIGENAHIEFIGAAATLIYLEWEKSGMQDKMSRSTALLLIAAILDNTLNLTSSNTTAADVRAFEALCKKEDVGDEWRAAYFREVQESVEADLKNALFKDVKIISGSTVLPSNTAQICVWNSQRIVERLSEIRQWFNEKRDSWMINIIDIERCRSCFVCDDVDRQRVLGKIFDVRFDDGVAVTSKAYLRKEIIKIIQNNPQRL